MKPMSMGFRSGEKILTGNILTGLGMDRKAQDPAVPVIKGSDYGRN
jgi:hypothetical protein